MRNIRLLFLVLLLISVSPEATTRGVRVVDAKGIQVADYSESHALLIGVSNYTAGWPDLENVPGELKQVERVLKTQGFQVVKHLNPNSDELKQAFEEFIVEHGYRRDNRLLFFYSGHGHTWQEAGHGYLVPSDAPRPAKGEGDPGLEFLRKALHMSQILALSLQMTVNHALFVLDSCFSGTIFKTKALPKRPPYVERAMGLPVRQFITAGSAGEEVPAQSTFTPAFADALEYRKGDLNGDGYITGTELGLYLADLVPQHQRQSPQFGKHRDYRLSRGDFVFVLRVPALAPVMVPLHPRFSVGERILSNWMGKGCLYRGRVLETEEERVLVIYDFSAEEWVKANQVFALRNASPNELTLNRRVYVRAGPSDNKWLPGKIKEKRNDQYLVRIDQKHACVEGISHAWTTFDSLILTK